MFWTKLLMGRGTVDLDRRQLKRLKSFFHIIADRADHGHTVHLTASDLSQRGVGFIGTTPLEPGEKVRLWLRLRPQDEPMELTAVIVWCSRESEGQAFRGGAAFTKVSAAARKRLDQILKEGGITLEEA